MTRHAKPFLAIVAALALLSLVAVMQRDTASASHAWSTYHWARTANPFTLKLGDNVNGLWDVNLAVASADWSASTVLDTTIVAGLGGTNCKAQSGRIEVCNKKYGFNGWLGIAQISISGSHITRATAKMNDSYFNAAPYNTNAWRQLVMCQEVAHGFGLGHQDETHNNPNLGTCMDYTSSPASNMHPNGHDFEMLELIYAHVDAFTTVASSAVSSPFGAGRDGGLSGAEFGLAIGKEGHGRSNEFVQDLGNGQKIITHVFWVPGSERGHHEE